MVPSPPLDAATGASGRSCRHGCRPRGTPTCAWSTPRRCRGRAGRGTDFGAVEAPKAATRWPRAGRRAARLLEDGLRPALLPASRRPRRRARRAPGRAVARPPAATSAASCTSCSSGFRSARRRRRACAGWRRRSPPPSASTRRPRARAASTRRGPSPPVIDRARPRRGSGASCRSASPTRAARRGDRRPRVRGGRPARGRRLQDATRSPPTRSSSRPTAQRAAPALRPRPHAGARAAGARAAHRVHRARASGRGVDRLRHLDPSGRNHKGLDENLPRLARGTLESGSQRLADVLFRPNRADRVLGFFALLVIPVGRFGSTPRRRASWRSASTGACPGGWPLGRSSSSPLSLGRPHALPRVRPPTIWVAGRSSRRVAPSPRPPWGNRLCGFSRPCLVVFCSAAGPSRAYRVIPFAGDGLTVRTRAG